MCKHQPGKGERFGECNRTACRHRVATWFNPHTDAYYCAWCAERINQSLRAGNLRRCEDTSTLTRDADPTPAQQVKP